MYSEDRPHPADESWLNRVREHVARIVASDVFTNSVRMQRFLTLVTEYALSGRVKELKEYLIGVEAFDRSASFDPREDPIVRVEARRLRRKLKSYYDGPGRHDDVLIEFPKGSYAPRFVERQLAKETDEGPRSIAVLPFRNLGPAPDHEYFSDGLSEELIHLLTTIPGLRVVAWHSAVRLKGDLSDLQGVRQQLRVDTVLCGTVRRVADQLRITAQLIDTEDGRYLWSDLYERRMQDLFAIEEDIAWAIVNTLQIHLLKRPAVSATRQTVTNIEAYNLYLLGRYHANRRTLEGVAKSVACFEKAIALDPDNALAHGALAETYGLAAEYALRPPGEFVPLATAAARRALELDPMLAEAYTSLANLRGSYDWEWSEAERLFRRAIELNPGYATARHWFGVDHLASRGRFDEAHEEVEMARRLDPLSAIILVSEGYLCLLERRFDEALRWYHEILELDPYFPKTFSAIGRVYTEMGQYDMAIEMYEKSLAFSRSVPNVLGALGQTYALNGRDTKAGKVLNELHELSENSYVPMTCFAIVHIGLGEYDKALTFLEEGADRRDLALTALKVHPVYDPLRKHPRFRELLRRVRLA